jgi:pentatricopeptide repeat protein
MELLKEGMQLAPPLLKPQLGFHPDAHIISFDCDGVLATPTHETETTLFHLAPTLIRFHESNGAVVARTQFDLARREGRLKETVAQCMREMGLAPVTGVRKNGTPNKDRLESGQVVLPRCLEYGHFDSALATFYEITGQGFLPTTAECSRLISACHKRQRTQDSAKVFSALILACAQSERPDDALDYFSQAVSADAYPNAAASCALIRACGSAGRLDEAKAVFGKLLTSQIEFKLAICNVMLSTCEQHGWIGEARLAFNAMLQFGVQPDASSYIAIISAYQRGRQKDEKIGRLFSQAIHERHFDSVLGYVVAEARGGEAVRMLDLRAAAIAPERAQDAPPVSVHFALALLQHHKAQGHIDGDTQFVVDNAIRARFEEMTGIRC